MIRLWRKCPKEKEKKGHHKEIFSSISIIVALSMHHEISPKKKIREKNGKIRHTHCISNLKSYPLSNHRHPSHTSCRNSLRRNTHCPHPFFDPLHRVRVQLGFLAFARVPWTLAAAIMLATFTLLRQVSERPRTLVAGPSHVNAYGVAFSNGYAGVARIPRGVFVRFSPVGDFSDAIQSVGFVARS